MYDKIFKISFDIFLSPKGSLSKKIYQIAKTSIIPTDRGGRETRFGPINQRQNFKKFFEIFLSSKGSLV